MTTGVALGATSTGSLATFDVNEVCTNSCQSASDAQRDTCMQMCRQFAEQGIQFLPASTTHGPVTVTVTASQRANTSATPPVRASAPKSSAASPASSSSASAVPGSAPSSSSVEARSDKERMKNEESDEDDASDGSNRSGSEMSSSAAAAARLSAAALMVGLSCVAFL
ncbi:hypothetical protein EV175_002572 [Coemansia sp. RSA 1933]|nr:hypothetical protein EV175_002572 [Coemansia sp. RSA 1933]